MDRFVFIYVSCLSLLRGLVCSFQPCNYLLGSLVGDVSCVFVFFPYGVSVVLDYIYFKSLHSSLLVNNNYIGTSTASRASMYVRCLIPRNCPRQFRLNYKCHVHGKRISARGKNPGIYLHQPATKIARTNQQRN